MKRGNRASLLFLLPALALLAAGADPQDREMKTFEGTWKWVSLESDGEQAPANVIESWRWVIKGNEISWSDQAGKVTTKTSFKIDSTQSPKEIDLTSLDPKQEGKMFKAIYQLEGDTLKVCIPEGKQAEMNPPRPTEFGGGKGMSLMVLERVKDK